MKKIIFSIFILTTLISLSACMRIKDNTLVHKRDINYLRSSSVTGLQVPPGLSNSKVGEDYEFPPGPTSTAPISQLPPDDLSNSRK